MGFPKLHRRRMTIFNPSVIFRPRQLYLKDVGPTKPPLWSIPLSIWGSSELFMSMNGSLLNQLGKHEQIPPVKLPTPCYFQTNRMSHRMLGKVAEKPTNTYENLISKISKISIISNKFTNQTSHRQKNEETKKLKHFNHIGGISANRGWPEAVALLSQLRPSSLEVQDFARTFCVTQKMPWSFLLRKERVVLLAKVVVDTGIGSFLGCWSWSFQFGVKMMDTWLAEAAL